MEKKVVFDTSAIIAGKLIKLLETKKLENTTIIIPEIVMGELQAQTARGKSIGFIGLEEIKKARPLVKKNKSKLLFYGERPSYENIMLAKSGRLDAMIQDIAKQKKATLITSDLPQALAAEAEGTKVKYFESYEKPKKLKVEKFFTKDTMSIHLKDGCIPTAKRGKPGKIKLVQIRKKKMNKEELKEIIKQIMESVRCEEDSTYEFGGKNANVVQIKDMRIAITRPPLSDKLEVTIVKPITKLSLEDYELSNRLKKRIEEKAEGILIAGMPGSGKSTFASSLTDLYLSKGKIVKTMERPRDLQVPKEVTQYGPLDGSFEKTSDLLLLVRPDYTIFDEIRKYKEFRIFADMRLAGVGMVGVVHASTPIDAIQRFIGKIELGIIPHVLDTIIFIKDGKINNVYNLSLVVRTPYGMTEADLARPLVEVRDFETGKLKNEIYTYGDQTVVMPIEEERKNPLKNLASKKIKEELRKFDKKMKIEWVGEDRIIVKLRNDKIAMFIGKEGKNIKKVEEYLGIHIDVEPLSETLKEKIKFDVGETGAYITLIFKKKLSGKQANVHIENKYLFTATIGRNGEIKISKNSDLGKELLRAVAGKRNMKVFI